MISNLLSKDVICALAEWGSAILEKGQEISFRKLQHIEFKKTTSIFSIGRKLDVSNSCCFVMHLVISGIFLKPEIFFNVIG